jgi:hypothetical protein
VKFSIIACYKYIEASLLQMFKYNLIIEWRVLDLDK